MGEIICNIIKAIIMAAFFCGFCYWLFLRLHDPVFLAVIAILAVLALSVYLVYFWADDLWTLLAAYFVISLMLGGLYFVGNRLS